MALNLFQSHWWNGHKIRIFNLNLSNWENPHSMPMWNDLTDRSEAILNRYVFKNLTEVKKITDDWMKEYNEERPYDLLNNMTSWEYLVKFEQQENSSLQCT